jgi:NAD-dependent dihydropyrimidine dehydrogenase PreA subunit
MYRHDRDGREQHKGKEWRRIHEHQETELGHMLTYVTEGDVEFEGKKATLRINQRTCVGATMCAFSCPANIFELVNDKSYLVRENLHKCLLHNCMKCRDYCPTHSVHITLQY